MLLKRRLGSLLSLSRKEETACETRLTNPSAFNNLESVSVAPMAEITATSLGGRSPAAYLLHTEAQMKRPDALEQTGLVRQADLPSFHGNLVSPANGGRCNASTTHPSVQADELDRARDAAVSVKADEGDCKDSGFVSAIARQHDATKRPGDNFSRHASHRDFAGLAPQHPSSTKPRVQSHLVTLPAIITDHQPAPLSFATTRSDARESSGNASGSSAIGKGVLKIDFRFDLTL